jgi:hypothetical protein
MMMWNFDIAPRDALAAPTTDSQTYTLSVVILVISILSTLGAGWIMLSFCVGTPNPSCWITVLLISVAGLQESPVLPPQAYPVRATNVLGEAES